MIALSIAPQHIRSLKRMVMSSTEFSWHPVKENTGQFDVKKHGNTLLLGMPFWGMVSYTQASKGVKCFYVSFSESIQSRAPPETLSS